MEPDVSNTPRSSANHRRYPTPAEGQPFSFGDTVKGGTGIDTVLYGGTDPVVVTLDGVLRLAPRRSEHVALAGGRHVLAAGEMTFVGSAPGWRVTPAQRSVSPDERTRPVKSAG